MMRQLGDLLVWVSLILVMVGVVYYTPKVAEYLTAGPPPGQEHDSGHKLAWFRSILPDDTP